MEPRADTVLIMRTYDETLSLMVEARNYLAYKEPRERPMLGAQTRVMACGEAFRVTSRLTQVMAWLMMQRALCDGEIGLAEAYADDHRLSEETVCLDDSGGRDERLPKGLRSLLVRSHQLYCRIARLDEMARGRLH